MQDSLLICCLFLAANASCSREPKKERIETPAPTSAVAGAQDNAAASSGKPSGSAAPLATASETIPAVSLQTAEVCRKALERKTPVLVEFSADWCQDCRRLSRMKAESPLREELTRWQELKIDVDDERYEDIKNAFTVRSIARWLLLAPTDCTAPLTAWPRLADRVLEPTRDEAITGASLVTWLHKNRPQG